MGDSTELQVRTLIAKHLGQPLDDVTPASRIMEDLGADSLDLAELLQQLEDVFETHVDERDASKFQTVADIVAYIDGLRSEGQPRAVP